MQANLPFTSRSTNTERNGSPTPTSERCKELCITYSCYITSILPSAVAELPRRAGLPIYDLASPGWRKL